jgi:hypothetical protein
MLRGAFARQKGAKGNGSRALIGKVTRRTAPLMLEESISLSLWSQTWRMLHTEQTTEDQTRPQRVEGEGWQG